MEDSKEISTSKKNPSTRRVELLQYMKETLVELCVMHANVLLRSRCGSKVIREVFESFPSKDLVCAIAETCGQIDNEPSSSSKLSMLEDSIGHMTIKNMIVHEAEAKNRSFPDESSLAKTLFKKYNGKLLDEIGRSNRGAFVLSAMTGVVPEVKNEVGAQVSDIQKIIKKGSGPSAGYEALIKAIGSN